MEADDVGGGEEFVQLDLLAAVGGDGFNSVTRATREAAP